ncbi:unnamed protein product, partial [Coregonus sp. 'balchen']
MRTSVGSQPLNLTAFARDQPLGTGGTTHMPSFMVLRLPKDILQSSADGWSPWESPPSEEEIRNSLTAHHKRQVPHCTHTQMRHNHCQPRQRSELHGNMSRYGCNALHG